MRRFSISILFLLTLVQSAFATGDPGAEEPYILESQGRLASSESLQRLLALPETPMQPLPSAPAIPTLKADRATTTFLDPFDDGSLDERMWSAQSSGMTVQETEGRLHISGQASMGESAYTQVLLRQTLMPAGGDVIAEIEFSDLQTSGYATCQLALVQEGGGTSYVGTLANGGTQSVFFQYYSDDGYAYRVVNYPVQTGKLRLVYHYDSGVTEGFVDLGEGWISLGNSAGFTIDPDLGFICALTVSTYGLDSASLVDVKLDNFRAEGGIHLPPALGERGIFEELTFQSAGLTREYRLLVPEDYDSRRPIGVFFGFHGGGARDSAEPYLGHMASMGYESRADEGYWLAISLAMPRGGWWDLSNNSTNKDARAVQDLVNFLEQYYAIDHDRIFTTGFSSGGRICSQLALCLPDYFAAVAPEVGVHATAPQPGHEPGLIGTGGIRDTTWGSTANSLRTVSNQYRRYLADADCWIVDMDHSRPPDDATVWPARPWPDIVTDYFLFHPRGYSDRLHEPPRWVEPFSDPFDGAWPVPAARNWRLEMFDNTGVLYSAFDSSGSPARDVYGFRFLQEDGSLRSLRIGEPTREQGGYCLTGFVPQPTVWRASFTPGYLDIESEIHPVLLRDMKGRQLTLRLGPDVWDWRWSPTHLNARADNPTTPSIPNQGVVPLAVGRRFDFQAILKQDRLVWSLSSPELYETTGTLSLTAPWDGGPILEGPASFGFGVRGVNANVAFESASLVQAVSVRVIPDAKSDPQRRRICWTTDEATAGTAVRLELWCAGQYLADLGSDWNAACAGEKTVTLPPLETGRSYEVRAISTWDESLWAASEAISEPLQSAAGSGWNAYR